MYSFRQFVYRQNQGYSIQYPVPSVPMSPHSLCRTLKQFYESSIQRHETPSTPPGFSTICKMFSHPQLPSPILTAIETFYNYLLCARSSYTIFSLFALCLRLFFLLFPVFLLLNILYDIQFQILML